MLFFCSSYFHALLSPFSMAFCSGRIFCIYRIAGFFFREVPYFANFTNEREYLNRINLGEELSIHEKVFQIQFTKYASLEKKQQQQQQLYGMSHKNIQDTFWWSGQEEGRECKHICAFRLLLCILHTTMVWPGGRGENASMSAHSDSFSAFCTLPWSSPVLNHGAIAVCSSLVCPLHWWLTPEFSSRSRSRLLSVANEPRYFVQPDMQVQVWLLDEVDNYNSKKCASKTLLYNYIYSSPPLERLLIKDHITFKTTMPEDTCLGLYCFPPLMKDHPSSKTAICVNHRVVSQEGDYCILREYFSTIIEEHEDDIIFFV